MSFVANSSTNIVAASARLRVFVWILALSVGLMVGIRSPATAEADDDRNDNERQMPDGVVFTVTSAAQLERVPRNARQIVLSRTVDDLPIAAAERLGSLEHLDVRHAKSDEFTEAYQRGLAVLLKVPSLRTLTVRSMPLMKSLGEPALAASHITSVTVKLCSLDPDDVNWLRNVQRLESLTFFHCTLSSSRSATALSELTGIKTLNISDGWTDRPNGPGIHNAALLALIQSNRDTLVNVSIVGMNHHVDDAVLQRIRNCKNLKALTLPDQATFTAKAIESALRRMSLERLELRMVFADSEAEGAERVGEVLVNSPHLIACELRDVPDGTAYLPKLMCKAGLAEFRLVRSRWPRNEMRKRIKEVQPLSLTRISLREVTDIDDTFAQYCGRAKNLDYIELDAASTTADYELYEAIMQATKASSMILKDVELSYKHIGALSEAVPGIKRLVLSGLRDSMAVDTVEQMGWDLQVLTATDVPLDVLSSIVGSGRSTEQVTLRECDISKELIEGVAAQQNLISLTIADCHLVVTVDEFIMNVKKAKSLATLDVRGVSNLDESDVEKLRKECPDLYVLHN